MTGPEFFEGYHALCAMPEAENPDLYKRLRQLVDRMHERRAEWQRTGIQPGYVVGADLSPEECPDCRPEELCFGHGLLALVEEYRQTKAA